MSVSAKMSETKQTSSLDRIAICILSVLGIAGMICFMTYNFSSVGDASTTSLGMPDTWVVWEQGPNGKSTSFNPFRWSVLLGLSGVVAFGLAIKMQFGSKSLYETTKTKSQAVLKN